MPTASTATSVVNSGQSKGRSSLEAEEALVDEVGGRQRKRGDLLTAADEDDGASAAAVDECACATDMATGGPWLGGLEAERAAGATAHAASLLTETESRRATTSKPEVVRRMPLFSSLRLRARSNALETSPWTTPVGRQLSTPPAQTSQVKPSGGAAPSICPLLCHTPPLRGK